MGLKAVNYNDEGMRPVDAFHAAMAETRGMDVRPSENASEDIEVSRVLLDPIADEWFSGAVLMRTQPVRRVTFLRQP